MHPSFTSAPTHTWPRTPHQVPLPPSISPAHVAPSPCSLLPGSAHAQWLVAARTGLPRCMFPPPPLASISPARAAPHSPSSPPGGAHAQWLVSSTHASTPPSRAAPPPPLHGNPPPPMSPRPSTPTWYLVFMHSGWQQAPPRPQPWKSCCLLISIAKALDPSCTNLLLLPCRPAPPFHPRSCTVAGERRSSEGQRSTMSQT